MTKLTTERLDKLQDNLLQFQDAYSDPADKENYDIFVDALHVLNEFKAAKEKLLAYEQAAKNPVAYRNKFTGRFFTLEQQPSAATDVEVYEPVFLAAPVLPKQPDATLMDEGKTAKIVKAAEKLVRCKGRYHSEQNYRALAALFGVTVPDLPPLPSDETPIQPESEIPFGDVEPIEVTDDMVYAFHNRLSDGSLTSDEFTDIKQGLCAALMNIPLPTQQAIPEPKYADFHDWLKDQKPYAYQVVYGDLDASEEEVIDAKATIMDMSMGWKAAIQSGAQPVIPEQIEPAAWRCDKEGTKGVVVTVHKQVADSWILKGWKVTPLIEANQSQPVSEPYKLPDGWVMVPQQIFLDASDIESICSQCGDGHKSGYGDFTDGLLWVGDIQCDNGTIMHGLHISSSDYQEEGGLTLAEFKSPAQESE